MPKDKIPMNDLISLSPSFLRSVHLERDFYAVDSADGYLVTRSSLSALSLLARGVSDPSYRAQCLSGPYGSGKSALGLYFAKLLDMMPSNGLRAKARKELSNMAQPLLPEGNSGYVTILATGTRESIGTSLTRSVKRSLERAGRHELLRELLRTHKRQIEAKAPSTKDVIELFEHLAKLAVGREHALGIIVIVDELGKLLEHAALHPEDSDVQILQELAEASSRSHEFPLWFITILHQQFSQYASRLGRRHQREWARVQQRFYDVPCILDGLDAFQLVSKALSSASKAAVSSNAKILETIRSCVQLAPRGAEQDFEKLCLSCYPLHPSSLTLLPSLFRRFGQNERSLFSFLAADEPYSLADWVQHTEFDPQNPEFVRLPYVYDYACTTLIGGAPTPQVARAWAEVEEAVVRLGDALPTEVDCLKTIGLLGVVGDTSRIAASRETLTLALSSTSQSAEQVSEALDSLEEKRLVVFRRFRNAFRLWEGSDVDIGERLAAAYQALPVQSVVLSVARELCPSPPLVARRHSFRTGMLRSFAVVPTSTEDLLTAFESREDTDGRVIHCLVENDEQRESVCSVFKRLHDSSVIVLVGKENDELVEAARDVAALDWVRKNTPALAGDRVARQELNERMLEAEMAFRAEWNSIFSPGARDTLCLWKGREVRVTSGRQFTSLLSDACDATFVYAPVVQNELINRRRLSSAAAAARGNLVRAMLSSEDQPGLGITGYPPERSIYESLLLQSGIHQQDENGTWSFGRPSEADEGLQKAWDLILERTYSESLKPLPLDELSKLLSIAPHGVADGFVPILLCACMIANAGTMALYEDGVFVAELSPAVTERLMRRPENFAVLRFGIDGERAQVIERFAKGLDVENGLLPVARSLCTRVAALPRYTQITRSLSEEAIAVREAVLRAKSPERLIFIDLPTAVGCRPFQPSVKESMDDGNAQLFFDRLNQAFEDLFQCYPALLARTKRGMLEVFDIPVDDACWRDKVERRADKLYESATDTKLRALAVRARESSLGDTEYLESLAAGMVGQPPSRWSRTEEDSFARLVPALSALVQTVESTQQLSSTLEDGEDGYLFSISDRSGSTIRQVLRFSSEDRTEVDKLALSFTDLATGDRKRRIVLAALAEAARHLVTASTEEIAADVANKDR